VRFANERQVRRLDQLTPALLDDFLASRPRTRPRSVNHLLGAVRGLLLATSRRDSTATLA
jgi:hypothetical protein